jgi:cytidine deaminase
MSHGPFAADRAGAARMKRLMESIGPAFAERLAAGMTGDSIVPSSIVERLIAEFELTGPRDVMLLALPAASRLAVAPISGFVVSAVGLEVETGDLILGGNVEFPGVDLGQTIHAEGFVFVRAFARATTIAVLATGQARPCAHCRQTITEFAASRDLLLIDPLGHTLSMSDLYPWPFAPDDLEQPGIIAGAVPWPDLALRDDRVASDVGAALVAAGRRAYAPYGRCPAAIVLQLTDGSLVAGATIESVAFNPTIGPLQVAIAELLASGHGYAAIGSATLAVTATGDVLPTAGIRALLAAIAPDAALIETAWA